MKRKRSVGQLFCGLHKLANLLAILGALAFLSCACPCARKEATGHRKLIIVSIDGLRPDFYLSDEFDAPTLKKLAREGVYAKEMTPVFPTLTYPNHTSLVTGVTPAVHGILSNTIFDPITGPTKKWYWESAKIKTPTLWKTARSAGRTSAAIFWPVTVGAEIDWLIPEVFSEKEFFGDETWQIFTSNVKKELLTEVEEGFPTKKITDFTNHDEWIAHATQVLLKNHAPDLVLVHLAQVDHAQHETGRSSIETREAVKRVDHEVQQIIETADFKQYAILIVGDHGFENYSRLVNPNFLFKKRGWYKDNNWKAVAHVGGGQAAIYVKDNSITDSVLSELKRHAKGKYIIISKEKLKEVGAYPDAIAAVSAVKGFSIGSASDKFVDDKKKTFGTHGYLQTSNLATGFIAYGAGIKKGQRLEKADLLDVAATAAMIMDIPAPGQGTAMRILEDGK